MFGLRSLVAVATILGLARAHTVITYPGWRGNNLETNGTAPELNPDTLGIDYNANNDTWGFPYGMQWMYPCGGMPMTTNRTLWPYKGGAVSFQPGWFPGHAKAFMYINIGINAPGQQAPPNYSHAVVPPFAITGPNNSLYPGQFCLPQVPMPANLSLAVGDNITIQVIETAQHGAALYSCVDVTLAEPEDVENVTAQNCYNSTDIGFQMVYMTTSNTPSASGARPEKTPSSSLVLFALAVGTGAYALL